MNRAVLDVEAGKPTATRRVAVEFLFIDLEVCARCLGTNTNLEAALSEVSQLLAMAGIEVSVTKTLVESEEQARALRFFSSPTIRVNGKDIALEFRESRCETCESCACNGTVNCRVWVFQGREYTEAPTAMIVDAILREVYAGQPQSAPEQGPFEDVPGDLTRFFAGKAQQKATEESSCCSVGEQASCCEPTEKASCCSSPDSGSCGCK
ncbi:MAG: DUF2703 domain-containing protein [Armatimonadota bacterium]